MSASRSVTLPAPELLAPAGSAAAALVAFDHGADAVYAGLPRFNARERTTNLSLDEMGRVIRYAHEHGRKVYVTFNTLLREPELPDAARVLAELEKLAPDAVIVQDLGVLLMIRRYFPSLVAHASTQMAVHNSAGCEFLALHGVERVILERQVTFPELERIVANSPIQVEVFVHGALCCSLSGVCLFSSWQGGWSGNRGKCKQPCRRRYFGEQGNGFFFSTRDLFALDAVPELRRLGVASLKIEGRLRGTDYVGDAVRAYRMVLDAGAAPSPEAVKEAKAILANSPARQWSPGFRTRDAAERVIEHRRIGVQGRYLGTVCAVRENGFEVTLTTPLSLYEKLRVQPPSGDEGPAMVVTLLRDGRRSVRRVPAGHTAFIHTDKQVPADGQVFRIGRSGPDLSARAASLPPPVRHLRLQVSVTSAGIQVTVPDAPSLAPWESREAIAAARNRPLTPDAVRCEFRKPVVDGWIGDPEVQVADGLFLQQRDLRRTRQAFSEWLGPHRAELELGLATGGLERFRRDLAKRPFGDVVSPQNVTALLAGSDPPQVPAGARIARPAGDPGVFTSDQAVLPFFVPEDALPQAHSQFAESANRVGAIRVTSLFQLRWLAGGTRATASFPLPAANSFAVEFLREAGVECVCLWPELDREALDATLQRVGEVCEVFTFGRPPILATRAKIPTHGRITDARGNAFQIEHQDGITLLYPGLPMRLPDYENHARFLDLTHARLHETETTPFNFYRELA